MPVTPTPDRPLRPCGPTSTSRPFSPGRLAYGGDWNPEQWDDATVARDLEMMREAGVTLVSLGVFSWARLEPEEGRHDLDWLGAVIDRAHAAGIDVDLATGTASPPAWMARRHPESLPVTADGTRLGVGSRQQYCPSSRVYRERSRALAAALADRFGDHPGVVLWHIGNEYGCHVHECFCDQCASAFRAWLADRYDGSIAALNGAWGTDFWSQRYADFCEIEPPRAMPTFPNPSQALDWRRFCDHQIHALLAAEAAEIRRRSDRPVTTNFMGAFPWLDERRWACDVDVVSDDSYPDPADPGAAAEIAWQGDLMRGLGDGAPWLLMEQAPGAVQWRPRNSPKRPGQFLLWSLARVAHGADGVLQFQWRQSRAGAESFHSGMVPHADRDSRTWREVVDTGRALAALAPIAGARPAPADAAVLLDWDSEWARQTAIGPVEPPAPFAAARAWHRTLWEAGIATDFVFPDSDLEAGGADGTGYRLIVVAEHVTDDPRLAESLTRAARRGAQILVTGPTGVVDAHQGAVLGGYLGALRDLLGVRVLDHAACTGHAVGAPGADAPVSAGAAPFPSADTGSALVDRLTRAVGAPAAATWCGLEAVAPSLRRALDRIGRPAPDLRGGMWAEEIGPWRHGRIDEGGPVGPDGEGHEGDHGDPGEPGDPLSFLGGDVEVVARFDGRGGGADLAGRAAITRRPVGAARGESGAGDPDGGRSGAGGAAWYAATDLDAVGRAALAAVLCAHARVRPVLGGLPDGVEAQRRGDALFLLNHSDRAAQIAGVVGTDAVTGAACTGHVVVAPRSALVVREP